VAYVRPYELDLSRHKAGASDALVATVRYIGAAGPVVRLELQREDTGNSLDAEISRERFRELGLNVGDKVDVIARNLRVFAEELGSQGAGI
jgi:sulfate transport system ATP-binding protein